MIGKTVNGYSFVDNIDDILVLAHNPKPVTSLKPWVVWNLNSDGNPCNGSYFSSRDEAVNEFWARYLFEKAEYVLNSHSLNLTYQVYGQVQMAFRLHVISEETFSKLSEMLVRNGMNDPDANLN